MNLYIHHINLPEDKTKRKAEIKTAENINFMMKKVTNDWMSIVLQNCARRLLCRRIYVPLEATFNINSALNP